MSLIEFKNLPDTSTPLTADNLNNNFEYLDDKIPSVLNTQNNSTTDAYSCDYLNDCETYSTNEVKTNKTWIDNKPIYRRVFTLNTPILLNASWQNIFSIEGLNIEAITKLETLNNNDIAWNGTISRIHSNNLQLYYIGVGGAEWYVGKVILEYTKTTA